MLNKLAASSMKKILCPLAILFVGILGNSCSKQTSSHIASDELSRVEAAYCTNDIDGAERALKEHLKALSEEENNQLKGIDYDMARAITHQRLFLIYRKTHETNKMEIEFKNAIKSLSQAKKKVGLPPPPVITYDDFAALIERSERMEDVKWKRQ